MQGPTAPASESGAPPASVKVTVEQPAVVARSQGVSSAVLVHAQQAAAEPSGITRAPIHVGGGQALHVGADANTAGQAVDGQSGGKQSGTPSGGNQQGNPNAGSQTGQAATFGATIGQRGFGGETARAQFQDILATRTARPATSPALPTQAASTSGTLGSSSLLTAGPGGPQSCSSS